MGLKFGHFRQVAEEEASKDSVGREAAHNLLVTVIVIIVPELGEGKDITVMF